MDLRIYEADAIATPPSVPASPSIGFPTNGNPLTAQNATEPGDWWFYQLSEEMRALILEGGLTPDHTSLTQLRDAIKNIVKGGDYKESVRVASTAAINLAAPGANIDGVAMVAGNRFLEKDHATLASRGIYIWNGAAVAATRATDADTGTEFNGGAIIPVEEGTVNANTNWQMTNDGTVTIGTTGLTFQQVGNPVDGSETVKGVFQLCTDAEARAFTANKVIDGAKLNTAFKGGNQSLAANGYQKLPGGLIIQWGISATSVANSVTINVTFPIAFPNACVVGHAIENSLVEIGASAAFNSTFTTTTLNVHNKDDAGAKAGFSWFAVGY